MLRNELFQITRVTILVDNNQIVIDLECLFEFRNEGKLALTEDLELGQG